ncbi:replication protein A 70 kDa DNA-binding subunit-like isoform X2 [Homarus americanus]|uniref:replication protein A 70 kDa DNA-binding subunit-like isoform X2 n=1 Tax=Homarus americanus TaxID=6706 RepID=UPI001C492130|nr:replication protein A 70 kDa DNA-binding subunit-like isoform X2 [Homarus americanus]
MTGLCTGVIADIIEGAHPENPILQVLSMKRLPTESEERYRLLVSDGEWSSNFAMYARHPNSKVTKEEITKNCIIQMNRYVCETVQENKKVLIILELKLERTGEDVGLKLGDPVNYDPSKPRTQQQPKQQQRSQPHLPTPSMRATGDHNPFKQGISPSKSPTGGNVHPICSLTPCQNKVNIHVKKKSGIGESVPPSPPEYDILATAAVQKVKEGLEAAIGTRLKFVLYMCDTNKNY